MKRPCYHFAWVDSPTSGVHWGPDSHFPPCSPASVSWQSSSSSGVYQLPTESSCKFLPVRLAGRAESHWEAWFEPRSWDPWGKQVASVFSPVKWPHPTAENRRVQPNGSCSHPSVGPGMGQPGAGGACSHHPVPLLQLPAQCLHPSGRGSYSGHTQSGEGSGLDSGHADRGSRVSLQPPPPHGFSS